MNTALLARQRHPAPVWPGRMAAALATLAALAAVARVHAAGQALLAVMLLVLTTIALWAYSSRRTHALRYLFPGVAAAVVFVVFPMLYTVGIGFTNYSSSNLLDRARATAYLQEEAVHKLGSMRPYTLHRSAEGLRVLLPADASRPALQSPPLALDGVAASVAIPESPAASTNAVATSSPEVPLLEAAAAAPGAELPLRDTVALLPVLRALSLRAPGGEVYTLADLRHMAVLQPLYRLDAAGVLTDQLSGTAYRADDSTGFYTSAQGDRLTPGYRVGVGLAHYRQIFSEGKFREPFVSVLLWTVAFAALSVLGAAGLGLVLAVMLNWDALRFKAAYRLVLFLPYAVPGFISILVFKGLFNQNLGEVNLILGQLFGIKPAWFSDPWLARLMLMLVNVWLGFPYMMVLCSGLIKAIPADLYEASAVAGAGAWVNFRAITLPLILKPLTPLLISAFAFNFNNFVLISLLTGGRPDQLDTTLPAGSTDILVSYTWRIAFQDSGQQFGLASAISTVIFLIVAAITLIQMRYTRITADEPRG